MRIDLGELCVHCGNSTAFGSGRFVDRYPVFWLQRDGDGIEYTGYCCNECELAFEAERGEQSVTYSPSTSSGGYGMRITHHLTDRKYRMDNIFEYRNNREEEWQDLTDFDCLEMRVFTDDINGGYIAEFLITYGGPTVRLTIDSRYRYGELFHSWGVNYDGNKKDTVNISEEVTNNFKEFIETSCITFV